MILTMKKGSATADQSKRRTQHTRLPSLSLNYHQRQILSMAKCQYCGSEENLIGRICESCLIRNRQPGKVVLRFAAMPGEEEKQWMEL